MKVIRLYNHAASKEPLAVTTWNGEIDSLPSPTQTLGEGGCISYASVQGDDGALCYLRVGGVGSGMPIEVEKTSLKKGDSVNFVCIRNPKNYDEVNSMLGTILSQMPEIKVCAGVSVIRDGVVVYGE